MSVPELLAEGLNVTLLGMGVVFVLLGLLVFVVHGMSRLAQALEGEQPVSEAAAAAGVAGGIQADQELISAITAAIHRYRRAHRR